MGPSDPSFFPLNPGCPLTPQSASGSSGPVPSLPFRRSSSEGFCSDTWMVRAGRFSQGRRAKPFVAGRARSMVASTGSSGEAPPPGPVLPDGDRGTQKQE